jgi:hypothetical protein
MMTGVFLVAVSVLLLVFQANANAKNGKMGKSRTLIYKSEADSLAVQYLRMKKMYLQAQREHRELVMVYGSDTKHGVSASNLCDIFELPSNIQCEKHMKMKCPTANATEPNKEEKEDKEEEGSKAALKKKVLFHCSPSNEYGSSEEINAAIGTFTEAFPMRLKDQRVEEVQYIQAMMGVVKKQTKKLTDYTVVYWGDAHQHLGKDLGKCAAGDDFAAQETAVCKEFKQAAAALVQQSKPYCNHFALINLGAVRTPEMELVTHGAGLCYLAGATHATAKEASILLDMGLQSFRGVWLQHQAKAGAEINLSVRDAADLEALLVHISPVSVEVMEWGIVLEANTFVSLTARASGVVASAEGSATTGGAAARQHAGKTVLLTSLAEYQRANSGKSFCTAHRDGLESAVVPAGAAVVDPSWCEKMKATNYIFKAHGTGGVGEDDGPFENATLNKFVVNLAISLLYVFSSRVLQLGLGVLSVVLIFGVFRLCYVRWKLTSTKTF